MWVLACNVVLMEVAFSLIRREKKTVIFLRIDLECGMRWAMNILNIIVNLWKIHVVYANIGPAL